MFRFFYFFTSTFGLLAIALGQLVWPHAWIFLFVLVPFILLGLYDITNTQHNLLRIYPVFGHLRYLFERMRPEIQQYFIHTDLSGRPFNREVRSVVYQRSKNLIDTIPFGTKQNITEPGYEFAYHSQCVKHPSADAAKLTIGNEQCKQPYYASRFNISAMSYGSLSSNAILALNHGAKLGNFAHNTGEGGLSEYHLKYGGDLIWQIGTGYFGCRTRSGDFDPIAFRAKATLDNVKMIELKISQGAKPSHGGILPAAKLTTEIAAIRGVQMGLDVLSPPVHSTFSTPIGCLEFIQKCRELADGKPVGFKLCIGYPYEFMAIVKAMHESKIHPDFITIDGANGGTGAAPLEFSNRLGMPLNEALVLVNNCLLGAGLRSSITIMVSGKIATAFDMIAKFALGADACSSARAFMFSLGCIQSLRCHLNDCPTGVATQDPRRVQGLVVKEKYLRVRNYHANTIKSMLELMGAMGVDHPELLNPSHIFNYTTSAVAQSFNQQYTFIKPNALLEGTAPVELQIMWDKVSAESFTLN